jgi:hypothetical protein
VVGKAALGQDFSEYLGFSASHSIDCSILIIIIVMYHLGRVQ